MKFCDYLPQDLECKWIYAADTDYWIWAKVEIQLLRDAISERYKAEIQGKFGLYSKDGLPCLPKTAAKRSGSYSDPWEWRGRRVK